MGREQYLVVLPPLPVPHLISYLLLIILAHAFIFFYLTLKHGYKSTVFP